MRLVIYERVKSSEHGNNLVRWCACVCVFVAVMVCIHYEQCTLFLNDSKYFGANQYPNNCVRY